MKNLVPAFLVLFLAGNLVVSQPAKKPSQPPPKVKKVKEIRVTIKVFLPVAEAQLWIDDKLTKQKGTERIFTTPALEPGNYVYTFKARWRDKEVGVTAEKTVRFRPGTEEVVVDFRKKMPPPKKQANRL